MFAASSPAGKSTARATSSGVLARRDGKRATMSVMCLPMPVTLSVMVGPGATALTRTPCDAYSSANDMVSEWMAALVTL
jgi:hypothetical protein